MKTSVKDGKVYLHRSVEERQPLLQRLARVEGQIRGIASMIEADRYCGDELQQIKAVIAALRAVGMQIAEQHVLAAAQHATGGSLDAPLDLDMRTVLQRALEI